MIHGRHEDQEAAGQRDVAGDARALLGDGLLRDLYQDLLPLLQQVADDGQVGNLGRWTASASAMSAAARLHCCGGDGGHGLDDRHCGLRDARAQAHRLPELPVHGCLFFRKIGFGKSAARVFELLVLIFFFFGVRFGSHTLFQVSVAHDVAEFDPVLMFECLFFQLFQVVLVCMRVNRLELVFFLVDRLFFDQSRCQVQSHAIPVSSSNPARHSRHGTLRIV